MDILYKEDETKKMKCEWAALWYYSYENNKNAKTWPYRVTMKMNFLSNVEYYPVNIWLK